jgi:outer membrane protein TolC
MKTNWRKTSKSLLLTGTIMFGAASAPAQTPLSVNSAIKSALANNPGYQSQNLGVESAELELEKAKAGRLPTLDLRSGYTHYSDPMIIVPIHEMGVFPELDNDIFSSGIYAQMPLYTGGRLSASKDLARAQIKGSKYKQETTRQNLILSVMSYYTELLTLEKMLTASDQRLEFYRKELTRIELLLSQGRATDLDKAKINTQLEKAKYDRLQLDMAYDQNRVMLATLMSEDIAKDLLLANYSVASSRLPASLDEALSTARQSHPVLKDAAVQMEAAESKISIAKAAKKPQLSAIGNARAMSGGDLSMQDEWQIGIQFSIPLFDGKIKSRNIAQARIGKSQARLAYDNLVLQTEASVKNSWQGVSAAQQGIGVAQAGLSQAEQALQIERLRYDNSRASLNDLTFAETALWEARSNVARAQYQYELSKARLLKSMGLLEADTLSPALF